MSLDEKMLSFQEENIPKLAGTATRQAYYRALASGNTVLEVVEDELVETHPDGTRVLVKKMPAVKKMLVGTKRRISS